MQIIKFKDHPHIDMHDNTYRSNPDRFLNPVKFTLFAVIVLLFFACKKDDGPPLAPTIQLLPQPGMISSDTTIAVGKLMTFAISARAGSANLTNLIAMRGGTQQVIQRALDTGMNIPRFSIAKTFTKNLGEKEFWTFIVRDKNRMSDSVSVVISLDTTSGFGPIKYYETLILSAQNKIEPGSFFSFITGQTYVLDEAFQNQGLIDLVYYFGENDHTIGSPGANIEEGIFENNPASWDIRRTTRFMAIDLPPEVFENARNDSLLLASYIEGEGKRKAKLLNPGNTFSFQTQDLKYGIFRVKEVVGTDAGTIKIDVKIQDKE
jgi:hypothetical protein